MNELEKAIGGVDVIDVLNNLVDNAKRKSQMKAVIDVMDSAIESLNLVKTAKPSGYETEIEINGYPFEAIVDYEITPACKGGTGDFGMKTEPDESASISMGAVYIKDGTWNLVDIPESAMKGVLDEILEHEVS